MGRRTAGSAAPVTRGGRSGLKVKCVGEAAGGILAPEGESLWDQWVWALFGIGVCR